MVETHTPPGEMYAGRIAMKPHLLRYVQWREGLKDSAAPLLVPGLGPIAEVLSMLLVDDRNFLSARPLQSVEGFSATLHYHVIARNVLSGHRYVTDEGTRHFNRFLQQLLQDDLYFRSAEARKQRTQEKIVIETFLHDTGLDEWLEFDTAKKAQFRLRQIRSGVNVSGYVPFLIAM